jgi:hypothetical protein
VTTIQYHLCAAIKSPESLAVTLQEKYRYNRYDRNYYLIYSLHVPDEWTEIDDLSILTSDEMDWVNNTEKQIMAQFVKEHPYATQKGESEFLKQFELELEKERRKLLNGEETQG